MSDENDKGSSVSDDAPDSGASSSQSPASSIQNGKKNKKPPVDELSAEDKALKESLELLVLRVRDPIAGVARLALETMRIEIRTSTSSMTSVPKPLKFLRAHYPTLANDFKTPEVVPDEGNRKLLADILSVLAMTTTGDRQSIRFKLQGNLDDIGSWGHEFVRHLSREIAEEYAQIVQRESNALTDDTSEAATDDQPAAASSSSSSSSGDVP